MLLNKRGMCGCVAGCEQICLRLMILLPAYGLAGFSGLILWLICACVQLGVLVGQLLLLPRHIKCLAAWLSFCKHS